MNICFLFRTRNHNKMVTLNDDEWLIIFKMLNLNERTNLRLVSKRFKRLLDTIKITKLVIYQKRCALPGRLNYTDEPYGIQDTAEVYDLNKFFNNPIILDQMQPIRQLVIECHMKDKEIDLNTEFTKLNYLRLRNAMFTNSSLLQSAELEHLILELSFFKSTKLCMTFLMERIQNGELDADYGLPQLVFNYQFNELKSRKLKYLNLDLTDPTFLEYCVEHDLFSSLEEIDFMFNDFESLLLLNDRCPALKIVTCQVGWNYEGFLRQVDMIEYASKRLRDDLSVYLFGM